MDKFKPWLDKYIVYGLLIKKKRTFKTQVTHQRIVKKYEIKPGLTFSLALMIFKSWPFFLIICFIKVKKTCVDGCSHLLVKFGSDISLFQWSMTVKCLQCTNTYEEDLKWLNTLEYPISKKTFKIRRYDTQHNDIQHNDTQNNF